MNSWIFIKILINIYYKTLFITKKSSLGFEPAKIHWAFLSVTNAFQDEYWDLSNSKGYEFDRNILSIISTKLLNFT